MRWTLVLAVGVVEAGDSGRGRPTSAKPRSLRTEAALHVSAQLALLGLLF